MRHADLAKHEVTESAVIGLPVQSVKMSMKAPRYSQPDLETASMAVELDSGIYPSFHNSADSTVVQYIYCSVLMVTLHVSTHALPRNL